MSRQFDLLTYSHWFNSSLPHGRLLRLRRVGQHGQIWLRRWAWRISLALAAIRFALRSIAYVKLPKKELPKNLGALWQPSRVGGHFQQLNWREYFCTGWSRTLKVSTTLARLWPRRWYLSRLPAETRNS